MKKRVVVVGMVAAGLMVAGGQGAAANVMWCVGDPPIQVVTPGGHHLMVNNMVYLPVEDRALARQVTDDAHAVPDGSGGTLITVHVSLPHGAHGGAVVSSNYRFKVSDTQAAAGGGVLLTLVLDVPMD